MPPHQKSLVTCEAVQVHHILYISPSQRSFILILIFSLSIEFYWYLFSSPVPKAQVSLFYHNLSVVRRCCRRCRRDSNFFTYSIFIVFSRTTGLISTKLGTKHPWVKGIQVCSTEGPRPFPRKDNYKIQKSIDKFKKNLLLQHRWANFN